MARSSAYRRSKGGRAGRPLTPGTPPASGSYRVAVGSRTFKRSRGSARGAYSRPNSGVATRVASRRRSMQRTAEWGQDAHHAHQLSAGGGESSDDFYTPPRVLEDVGLEGSPRAAPGHADTQFPHITTRGMPRQLVRVVGSLTPRQRRDVTSVGMGRLLGLRITELPLRLGYWLVSRFDPTEMRLDLGNGRFIKITKEDVAAVLGLPNGTIPITERVTQDVGPDLYQWRTEVKQQRGRVTIKALSTLLLGLKGGGVWFKRHFSVVVVSTLVSSTPNGYANQKIVHMFSDVSKIKDLDWCEYLLRSLVSTHASWTQNTNRKFTGPLLFLILLYVDRVVDTTRDVPRTIPVLDGWTTEQIKARECREVSAGVFGNGQVEPPLCASSYPMMMGSARTRPRVDQPQWQRDNGTRSDHPMPAAAHDQGFDQQFATIAGDLRSVASRVVEIVQHHPKQVQDHHDFVQVVATVGSLHGVFQQPKPRGVHELPAVTQVDDDESMWEDPGFIKELDRLVLEASQSTRGVDAPKFSLGMTQELSTQNLEKNRARPPGVSTPPPQVPQQMQGMGWGLQPSPQCAGPVRPVVAERKGRGPAVPGEYPMGRFFSTTDGYPAIPLPTVSVAWMWVLACPLGESNDVLFQRVKCKARWAHFKTLRERTNVAKPIVDAWCSVLNLRERTKEPAEPSRIFFTTGTTIGTVVDASANQDDRVMWFTRRLDAELETTNHVGTESIDMFIFPIMHGGRYYMMSISFKHSRFDIIDSSSTNRPNKDLYGRAPQELIDLLSTYLVSKQQTPRAFRLESMKPKRMQMAWRDTTSTLDSAVFTMRHMEAYTGQSCANWDCGLQRGKSHQLLDLRKRFMHNILFCEENEHMENVASRIGQYDIQMGAHLHK